MRFVALSYNSLNNNGMVKKPRWDFGDKMGRATACHTTCWHSWPSLGGRRWHKPHAREVCEGGQHSSVFWDDTGYNAPSEYTTHHRSLAHEGSGCKVNGVNSRREWETRGRTQCQDRPSRMEPLFKS